LGIDIQARKCERTTKIGKPWGIVGRKKLGHEGRLTQRGGTIGPGGTHALAKYESSFCEWERPSERRRTENAQRKEVGSKLANVLVDNRETTCARPPKYGVRPRLLD